MLDRTTNPASLAQNASGSLPPVKQRAVFRMVTNDRMAGSVPAWIRADTAKDQTLAALSSGKGATATSGHFTGDLSEAMGYAPQDIEPAAGGAGDGDPFTFNDLLDIINPLQHIPVVSTVYRAITGDSIRASSDIVGGAIYGGFVGAASGIADAIVKQETGKNVAEHALALVTGDSSTTMASIAPIGNTTTAFAASPGTTARDNPIENLATAQKQATPLAELPGNMLSFVELKQTAQEPQQNRQKTLQAKPERYADVYKFNA